MRGSRRCIRRATVLLLGMWFGGPALNAAHAEQLDTKTPNVVVSIKPLHSLVANVMRGVGSPVLLVPGAIHDHTELSQEQRAVVERADVVIWIGPQFESFLERPIVASGRDIVNVKLIETEGIRLMDVRSPGAIDRERADAIRRRAEDENRPVEEIERERRLEQARRGGRQISDEEVIPEQPDPRLWLSPRNAIPMARAVADALAVADPPNANRYQRNALRLRIALETLDGEINALFIGLRDQRYATLDNTLQYFERNYTLAPQMRVDMDPGKDYSNAELREFRVSFNEKQVDCIIRPAGFDEELAKLVTRRAKGRLHSVDIYGREIDAGPDAYFETMRQIATEFAACLDPTTR